MTQLVHRIRIYPNNVQETYLKRACGIRRFAYNWALSESRRLYEEGTKTSGFDLVKRFNAIKSEQFPWTSQVSKWAPQKAIQDVWTAHLNWWKGIAKAPRFKKKGKCSESFYLGVDHFGVENCKLRIPKLDGKIRMAQEVRFPGKIKSATINQDGGQWFASFSVWIDETQWIYPHICKTQAVCGVDLGVRDLIVLDDGTKVSAPRGLEQKERKLRRLQKSVSRKQKGSRSRKRALLALNKTHRKIKAIRRNTIHKATAQIVESYQWIGLEDLNVKGMVKNHKLARSISDAAFGEVSRQLNYKTLLSGSEVVLADQWFPSSKLCNNCEERIEKLPLSIREWICPNCGTRHDRDINAAINLRKVAEKHSETQNAGGETVRPLDSARKLKAVSVKPEVGSLLTVMVEV